MEDVPAHGRGAGTRWSLRSLPTQTILWFSDSLILYPRLFSKICSCPLLESSHETGWHTYKSARILSDSFLCTCIVFLSWAVRHRHTDRHTHSIFATTRYHCGRRFLYLWTHYFIHILNRDARLLWNDGHSFHRTSLVPDLLWESLCFLLSLTLSLNL